MLSDNVGLLKRTGVQLRRVAMLRDPLEKVCMNAHRLGD
jgi:hypothetical protein